VFHRCDCSVAMCCYLIALCFIVVIIL